MALERECGQLQLEDSVCSCGLEISLGTSSSKCRTKCEFLLELLSKHQVREELSIVIMATKCVIMATKCVIMTTKCVIMATKCVFVARLLVYSISSKDQDTILKHFT